MTTAKKSNRLRVRAWREISMFVVFVPSAVGFGQVEANVFCRGYNCGVFVYRGRRLSSRTSRFSHIHLPRHTAHQRTHADDNNINQREFLARATLPYHLRCRRCCRKKRVITNKTSLGCKWGHGVLFQNTDRVGVRGMALVSCAPFLMLIVPLAGQKHLCELWTIFIVGMDETKARPGGRAAARCLNV